MWFSWVFSYYSLNPPIFSIMNPPNSLVRVSIILSTLICWMFFSYSDDIFALIYPAWAPPNEIVWGTYRSFFDNMFPGCPSVGDVITGFSPVWVPTCITPSVTWLNLPGALGYTLYHNGTTWVSSPNIYNANSNVGIGTATPWAKLEVAGQIKITGGSPGPGKILMSDATGLASWSLITSSFSGAYWSLTGNTITASDFIGSLNPEDFIFKTNGVEKMRILSTMNASGQVIIFTGGDLLIWDMRIGKGKTANSFNTAFWAFTLDSITTGNANTAIGHNGLWSLTTGGQNTSVGGWVLTQITTGNHNTAVGYTSQNNNLTASYNTSIWSRTLNANQVGLNNSVFWYRAGYILTSSNNILLGYQAGDALTTGANNIVLGYDIDVATPTSSNTLNIGNLLFGTGINGVNTTLSTGNIGIGVTNPSAKLEVAGQVKITGWSPGLGKYLASDASWLATWSTVNAGDMSGSFWSLSGNTIGNSDYLGTNNAKSLVFKSNAVERLRITSVGNIAWLDYANTLGWTNSLAIGLDAGTSMNGSYDTALGWYGAGYQMGWVYNTALWWAYAGYAMWGSSNVAIGTYAGTGMSTGDSNIYIGSYAIGNASQDNQFSLGNVIYGSGMGMAGLTSGRVGIGTRTPWQKLTISWGTIQILYGAYGSWKVLVSDTNGVASWWDAVTWTASAVSASGIVNGVANYVPKFWPGWVGLITWLLYDNGQTLWVGTTTPTAGYALHASGSLLIGNDEVFPDILNENFESATFPPVGWATVASGGITITRDTTTGSSGSASMRFNGNGANAQNASISYNISVAANSFLSFYWKASSEPGGDILSFCLDSTPCTINTSGITGWTKITYNLSPWSHILKWKYEKDWAFANGADAVWIDQVNIHRYGPTYLIWWHIGVGIPTPQYPLDVEGYIQSHGYCITGLCANTWRGIVEQWTSSPGFNGFVWASSLGMVTTGLYNIAFWPFSLAQTTTGNGNTAVGTQSQFANNTGSNNASIGLSSLFGNKWNNNTAAWTRSLNANITGNNNIALGYQSADALTTGSNNIVIGYDIDLPSVASSNMLNIGNLIYATGLNGANTMLSTGNVGIGSSAPWQKLTVSGGTLQIYNGSQWSGKVLMSDTNGVATWSDPGTAWSVSATGIINGVANYVPKFWSGGVGLISGLLYDNGVSLWVGTSTPSAWYILHASGNLLVWNDQVFPDLINESFEWTFAPAGWSTATAGGVTVTKDTTNASSGSSSVRFSGNGSNNANGSITYTINVTANSFLSFYWKASSEPGGDILSFCLDATPCTINISGSTGWEKMTYNISSGNHTLKWIYSKDANIANWLDSAWLDQVRFYRYGPTYLVWGHIGINVPAPAYPLDVEGYIQSHGYCISGACGNNWRNIVEQGSSVGSYNQFLWRSWLWLITTGVWNTALWAFSLGQLTTWNYNTSVGVNNLASNQAWAQNTSIGVGALFNSLWNGNIALGYNAGSTLTTGSNNIIIGINTNIANTASNQLNIGNWIYGNNGNIGIGTALPWQKLTISWGTIQVIDGTQWSGKVLMSDASGIASWSTPSATVSASWVIGWSGFYLPKFDSTWVGLISSLLYDNGNSLALGTTSATSRFEIWSGSTSYLHMRGVNNIGFGFGSVRPALTGNANSAYGHESLYTLTSGYSNSALGYQSLRFTTTGYNNAALWQESLYNNNDGTWNTAIGYQALRSGTSSDYNVALWSQALYNLGIGSGNVAIGNNALYGATTTASNNTALGYLAGSGITTGWNNITLGYNTQVASWTASNQLNIGNWIYGNGGKISIGKTSVGSGIYMLDVEWGFVNSSSWLCINDTCLSNWSNIFNAISGSGNALPKWNAAGTGLVASRIIENGTDILISTGSLQSVNITPANSNQYSQVLISSGWALKQGLTSREKLRIFAVSNYGGSAVQSLCMYSSSNVACGGMGSPAYTNVPNYNQVDAISYTGWIWDYVPASSVSKAPYFVSFYTGTYMVTTSYTFEAGSLTTLSWGCNFYPYYSVYSNIWAVPTLKKYTTGTDAIFTMDFSTVLSNVDSSTNLNVPDRRAKRVGMQFIQNVFMTPGQALVMTLWFQDPGDSCVGVTDRWVDLVTNSQKKQTLSIVEL